MMKHDELEHLPENLKAALLSLTDEWQSEQDLPHFWNDYKDLVGLKLAEWRSIDGTYFRRARLPSHND